MTSQNLQKKLLKKGKILVKLTPILKIYEKTSLFLFHHKWMCSCKTRCWMGIFPFKWPHVFSENSITWFYRCSLWRGTTNSSLVHQGEFDFYPQSNTTLFAEENRYFRHLDDFLSFVTEGFAWPMSINFSETLRSRFRLTPSTDVNC